MEETLKRLERRIQHAEQRIKQIEEMHGSNPTDKYNYYGGKELGYWRGLRAGYENAMDSIQEGNKMGNG